MRRLFVLRNMRANTLTAVSDILKLLSKYFEIEIQNVEPECCFDNSGRLLPVYKHMLNVAKLLIFR